MNNRKAFVFYKEWKEAIKDLPDDIRLEIYESIIEYATTGDIQGLKPMAKVAFNFIKADIDRDIEKYVSMAERNKSNGYKGGRPKTQNNPKNPVGFSETQNNPSKPKKAVEEEVEDEVEVEDKEEDYISPLSPNGDIPPGECVPKSENNISDNSLKKPKGEKEKSFAKKEKAETADLRHENGNSGMIGRFEDKRSNNGLYDDKKDIKQTCLPSTKPTSAQITVRHAEKKPNYSFDQFWELYDKKVGKKESLIKKWLKLSDIERELAMSYIPKYKQSQPDKKYRKNPETFLNQKAWNDELIFKNGNKQLSTGNQFGSERNNFNTARADAENKRAERANLVEMARAVLYSSSSPDN